jgi:hypothetical protein
VNEFPPASVRPPPVSSKPCRAPGAVLPFIPLMQGGGEGGIIQQWLALAGAEPDARRRGDHGGLALVFAEAAGRRDVWKQALQGWNMIQSQQVLEWQAEARVQGKAEGNVEGTVNALLQVLEVKFGQVPADLATVMRGTTDLQSLKNWLSVAVRASTLDEFRHSTQI